MALNRTFLMKILDIYSVLPMKDCISGTTLLLFYLTESQNINNCPLSPGSRQPHAPPPFLAFAPGVIS